MARGKGRGGERGRGKGRGKTTVVKSPVGSDLDADVDLGVFPLRLDLRFFLLNMSITPRLHRLYGLGLMDNLLRYFCNLFLRFLLLLSILR